jgi:uncharacterized membrane protein
MQCPKCHLENPPSADACDCGYSFSKGVYVSRPVNHSASVSAAAARGRYHALETVSNIYRIAAWLSAAGLIVVGIVLLVNATDQQKAYALPAAIGCFIYAGAAWLTCTFVAEGIGLFVDIAYDVRAIATKVNE